MAAEMCLIGVMDRLWFHQIILFSEPSSLFHLPQTPKKPHQPHQTEPKNSSQMPVISEQQEASPMPSVISDSNDETTTTTSSSSRSSQESDIGKETATTHDDEIINRPTRQNLASNKARSQSSSPISSQKQSRSNLSHSGYTYSGRRLQKTLSCKSLIELELEEVKGFMDLGFVFSKQSLSKPMMSLIPGLQRLDNEENGEKDCLELSSTDDGFEEYDEKGDHVVMRPYLSEAWQVKRREYSPPLMGLKVPRVLASEDMKKHLKNWARTVATAIQQES